MEGLAGYAALLRKWNRSIRLIGDDREPALARHIDDAEALLDVLPRRGRVIDVGSGNGLPAIPIAVSRPELELTLVEPIAKKIAFLRACRRELGLDNVAVTRGRDDEVRERSDFVPFDAAISQATFAPVDWLGRGVDLVRPGGSVIAMLGGDRSAIESLDEADEVIELTMIDGRSRALVIRRVGCG